MDCAPGLGEFVLAAGALLTLAVSTAVYLGAYHSRLPGPRVKQFVGVGQSRGE